MWICVCGNANARIRWNEYTYSIMWKHVIDNVDMCVRWNGNTYLMTWIYVFDYVRIRARWIGPLRLAECSQPISWVSVGISRNVRWTFRWCSQRYRNPFAAVGADLSRPHIRIHPQNDKRKCACGGVKTRIWWREYTYSIMWIYVFDYVRIRARWICPYAWRSVRTPFRGWALVFHGMFVGILRSVLCVFRWCSLHYRRPSAAFSQTVRSRRGPIYRARIYVYTHKMTNGNVCVMMWKCVFNNVKTRIW